MTLSNFAVLVALSLASLPSAAGTLRVEWTDQRLTVAAVDTPLRDVLRSIGEKSGTPMSGLEHVDGNVTVSLGPMPLQPALMQLLGKRPHALSVLHKPSPGKSGIEVQFHPRTAPGASKGTPEGGPLPRPGARSSDGI